MTETASVPVILQVVPSLVTGGVERGTIDIAGAIAEAGWTPLVASSGGPMVHELDRLKVRHIELPLASKNPFVMRENIQRLMKVIAENKVDIVHARSRAPAWSASIAAARAGVHFVTTFHGTYNLGWLGLKHAYNKVMTKGEHYMPYGSSKFEFDKTNTYAGLEGTGIATPHPRDYFEKLLTYQKKVDRRI